MHASRHAFTLIELLMVMAIITLLLAVSSSMLAHAQRVGRATATRSMLQRVEVAIGLFTTDIGVHPYQNFAPSDALPAAANDLFRRLGRPLTVSAQADLAADLATVESAYRGGSQAVTAATVDPRETTNLLAQQMHAGLVNRLAAERARMAVLSGNVAVRGIDVRPASDPASNRNIRILANPRSAGWCGDYLAGELAARDVDGDAILDAYGSPLVYICPVVLGVRGTLPPISVSGFYNPGIPVIEETYGMQTQGRAATTSLASDLRSSALPRHRFGFELWSAGPDRILDVQRQAMGNRDNLCLRDYAKGMVP
jgi:prepilin-type N-terminal cleavage/methylation domain-containing protein